MTVFFQLHGGILQPLTILPSAVRCTLRRVFTLALFEMLPGTIIAVAIAHGLDFRDMQATLLAAHHVAGLLR